MMGNNYWVLEITTIHAGNKHEQQPIISRKYMDGSYLFDGE